MARNPSQEYGEGEDRLKPRSRFLYKCITCDFTAFEEEAMRLHCCINQGYFNQYVKINVDTRDELITNQRRALETLWELYSGFVRAFHFTQLEKDIGESFKIALNGTLDEFIQKIKEQDDDK
jgi:hypothetical protein